MKKVLVFVIFFWFLSLASYEFYTQSLVKDKNDNGMIAILHAKKTEKVKLEETQKDSHSEKMKEKELDYSKLFQTY